MANGADEQSANLPVLVIAEIGTGHGGDLGRARELIAASVESGADCAKFQYVIAGEILHPATGRVELPGGAVDLYRRFEELEQPPVFYEKLAIACTDAGIEFLCTPFGSTSAEALVRIGVRRFKIASPELNHAPLLRQLTGYRLPLILSTGVSTLSDIEAALDLCAAVPVTLLHCITAYPAPEEQYNLALIPLLSQLFSVPVGISDHSLDPVLIPAIATLLGATAVEKHITLSQAGEGLDDAIALPPSDFADMVRAIRGASRARERDETGKLLKDLETSYGAGRVKRAIGTGKKQPADSERANYGRSNRSIHAVRSIVAGTSIGPGDVAVLRTEHNLNPGLSPFLLDCVVGAVCVRDVTDGAGIMWDDIIAR